MKRNFNLLVYIIMTLLLISSCDSGFGVWVRGITNSQTIKTSSDSELIAYENKFFIDYYISENIADQTTIRNIMTTNLNRVFKLIDNNNLYNISDENLELGVINNVRVINESLNSEVIVDQELFNLLKIAKNYSKQDKSYSLFNYNLKTYWEHLFSLYNENENDTSFDPYYNTINKSALESIVACIPHSNEEIDEMLVLDEEKLSVTFNVKESCQSENIAPYINLYDLSLAYLADKIEDELLAASFDLGLIYVGGNMVVTLGEAKVDRWSFALRDPRVKIEPGNYKTIASVATKDKFKALTIDDFAINQNYHFIDDVNNQVIYRHPQLNAFTGYPTNTVRSILTVSKTTSALDLWFNTNYLFNQENTSDIISKKEENLEVIFSYQTGIDEEELCNNKDWCPLRPSTLYLKSTSSFNDLLFVKDTVEYELLD